MVDQQFSRGTEVEVSSNEEGFMGAFYIASILESPSKKRKEPKKALIEYRSLLTDDGSGPLTEVVELSNIRPLPPEDDGKPFEEGEAVDAKWMDGWWTGVVRKVGDSRYVVYCDNPPDILELERKDLRLHWKWIDGKWIRPEKQKTTGSIFSSGTAVEVKRDIGNIRDVWVPAIVVRENEDISFLVKHQAPRNNAEGATAQYVTVDALHIRPTPPRYVDRRFELLERVDCAFEFGWRAGVITKVLSEKIYNVFFKLENEDKELAHSEVRPHVEWVDGKWIGKSKDVLIGSDQPKQVENAQDGVCNLDLDGKVKLSDSAKTKITEKTTCLSNASKNSLELSTSAIKKSLLDPNSKRENFTFRNGNIIRLTPSKILTKRSSAEKASPTGSNQSSKISNDVPCKEAANVMPTPMTEGPGTKFSKLSLICDQSSAKTDSPSLEKTTKTKRQKVGMSGDQTSGPLKTNVKAKGVPNKGKDGNAGTAEKISKGEVKTNASYTPVIIGLRAPSSASQKNANDGVQGNRVVATQEIGTGNIQKRKRGRPRKLPVTNSVSSVAGGEQTGGESVPVHALEENDLIASQDALRQKTSEGSENNFKIRELTISRDSKNTDDDDDQPLSAWIGGIRPSSVEESRLPSRRPVNESNEARELQAGDVEKSTVTDCEDGGLLQENQSLPFKKKSAFWKTIESMDVFNVLPQKPHFQPLSDMKEEFREGSAIGIMITFADLYEKISALQINCPRNAITSILESLEDLEKHGFDVTLPRDRLNALLSMKDQQSKLVQECEDRQRKAAEHANEITKLSEEKETIEKKLAELNQQLFILEQEMEVQKSEVATLKSISDDINEVEHIKKEFKKVASAPWRSLE